MLFSKYLRSKLDAKEINSKSLVAKLQLFSPVFEQLNSVTLSRWLNGRTIPSLEKQLLIFQCFESKLYPSLEYLNPPPVSRLSNKAYENVFNNIEFSYHSILMYKDCNLIFPISIEEINWSQLNSSVPNFYESLSSYKLFFSEVDKYNQKSITFCSIRNESKVVSHLSLSTDIEILPSIFDRELDIDFKRNSVFFNIGHYVCRKHYNILVGVLLNHIFDKHESIEDFYVISRGKDFLTLIESFGGKLIAANRENDVIGNVYLLKVNISKVLTNPFVVSLIKESYELYKEINKH
ncbi:conserved hypothetical protein [Vibrio jasicida]|uniref:hypothetical protein n=1 Tax=Vibrio jasicida TaxID=766224 RepID=UPI00289612B9|nr:conserved hypothetical protein [Vibrio jasicida]